MPTANTAAVISDLGRNLRRFRDMHGLNQRELSVRSDVSQATISRIEGGHVQQIRSESLRSLATALEVSVDELIAGQAVQHLSQRHRNMREIINDLRFGQAGRWLREDFSAAATGLAHALVDNAILPVVTIFRIDDAQRIAWDVCSLPESEPVEDQLHLDDEHPLRRCARTSLPADVESSGFTDYYVPLVRQGTCHAVLHTRCLIDQSQSLAQWLKAARPLFEDFSLVAELTAHPEAAVTPWSRFSLEAIAVDVAGRIIDANAAFLSLTAGERGDMIGKPLSTFLRRAGQTDHDETNSLASNAIMLSTTGITTPVDVHTSVVRRDGHEYRIRIVRENQSTRHELALTRIQRSFLEATSQNLEPVLQTTFGEIIGLGVPVLGVGINILNPDLQSFAAHTLLHPARMYVEETRHDAQHTDFHEWLAHWQRRETWTREWIPQVRSDGYAPAQVIDIPFRDGTVAAGLADPHIRCPGFIEFFRQFADCVTTGLARLHKAELDANVVLRSAWNASRYPAAILDSRGQICDSNAAWNLVARQLGIEGSTGQDLIQLCTDSDSPCHQRILRCVRQVLGGGRIEISDDLDCAGTQCPLSLGAPGAHCTIRVCRLEVPSEQDGRVILSLRHDDDFDA